MNALEMVYVTMEFVNVIVVSQGNFVIKEQ